MFNTQFGLLNQWMEKLGQETVRWLSSDVSAFLCCTVVNLWLALPFMFMIMDRAMQSIDHSYFESAILDGATWLERTRYITLPAITPIISPAVIITVFTTFKQFDVVYLLTQQAGAKTGSGFHTILTYAYENAFITKDFTLDNYKEVIFGENILTWFKNTVFLAVITVSLSLAIAVPAAYCFSRRRFPGRKTILKCLVLLNSFPVILSMFAIYRLLRPLGLINHRVGLILVYTGTMAVFSLWNTKGKTVKGKLGGTLRGVTENVDYLKDLGINCVYINPIFAAGEYHKYDLLDYFHVDPVFGGDEAFREMVDTLHANGIRIIIDGVFNHCGWHFFAFDDVVRNQKASQYWDWFYHLEFPVERPETPEIYPSYACFAYERMMPKLDTANPDVRDYFCKVGRYWVEEFGIDGWRLDVASEVDDGFWRAFRRTVKEANPDALLIGEVWESAGHWLQGDMFDSAMNYDFRKHCNLFFAEGAIDAADFAGRITNMRMRYRVQTVPAQLNLLDSHDVSRFLSVCNGDATKYKLAILFMMTFVGMPTVFYGDELGIQGVLEEEYRHPMPWNGSGDEELHKFFKKAIAMRHGFAALRRGTFRMISAEVGSGLLVYARELGDERVTVCINRGKCPAELSEIKGTLYWANDLRDRTLERGGFAVFSSCGL